MKEQVTTIPQCVLIRGELSASVDLMVEGRVEGKIGLGRNALTIGPSGQVEAEVLAKVVNVMGKVDGDISATETINILKTATVDGAIGAPQVGIEEGASFRGHIDISVRVPLQNVAKWLKPEKPHMRLLKKLIGSSTSVMRREPDSDLCRLIGVSPKPAEATMRLQVESDTRRERAS